MKLTIKTFPNSKGFTLIELIIYMGIFSILIIVLTQFFLAILEAKTSTQATSSVAGDGRYVYSRLIYDVNRASAIALPAQRGDISTALQLTVNGQNYTYAVTGGVLGVTGPLGTDTLTGYDTRISSLQFQRVANVTGKPTVQILYTIESRTTTRGRVDATAFQTTAGLR